MTTFATTYQEIAAPLTPTELSIMEKLYEHRNTAVEVNELYPLLRQFDGRNVYAVDNNLRVHIKNIRAKLPDDAPFELRSRRAGVASTSAYMLRTL